MGLSADCSAGMPTDERAAGSMQTFLDSGAQARIETVDAGDPHPNTYRLTLTQRQRTALAHRISTGGGMMEVISHRRPTGPHGWRLPQTLVWLPKGAAFHSTG